MTRKTLEYRWNHLDVDKKHASNSGRRILRSQKHEVHDVPSGAQTTISPPAAPYCQLRMQEPQVHKLSLMPRTLFLLFKTLSPTDSFRGERQAPYQG